MGTAGLSAFFLSALHQEQDRHNYCCETALAQTVQAGELVSAPQPHEIGAGVKGTAFCGCPAAWGCWDGLLKMKVGGPAQLVVGDTNSPSTGDPCQQDL